MAAKPSVAAGNDVHAVQTGTEGEAAAAAAGTVSGSPETAPHISDDGDVLVGVEPAATAPKNNTAASTPAQVPNGSSGRPSGNADLKDAPAASVQTAAEAPSVVVQISDDDKGTSDGEVKVNIVAVTLTQKPAEPVASSVDISDGCTDKADGSVKVDVTAVTAAQTARAHKSETGAASASGQQDTIRSQILAVERPSLAELLPAGDDRRDREAHVGSPGKLVAGTGFRKAGSQPSKMSNWLVGDSKQAGSEMDAGRALGNKASKSDEKAIQSDPSGTGSDEDDDTVVQVTVDRSLLG